ncbi:MAG: sarcosine oxidase subunit gamma [Hyphomicrobiaceae bacterium]
MAEPLLPASPLAAVATPGRRGRLSGFAGVTATEVPGLGIAEVVARRNRSAELAAAVRDAFRLDLPDSPSRVEADGIAVGWHGPGRWRVTAAAGPEALAPIMERRVADLASVIEQTHAFAVVRLSGSRVREALAKGLPIDLHPRAFGPGQVARTVLSHLPVAVACLDGAPTYELIVPRSLAGSFWHWLEAASGEYGLELLPPTSVSVHAP